jgi:hypothetical protein
LAILTQKLARHIPKQNWDYLFCEHGPEGFPGLAGRDFFSTNQIETAQSTWHFLSFGCNPKIDIELVFTMIKHQSKTNVTNPRGPVGPRGDSGVAANLFVQNFYFDTCIDPHIPQCNYTDKLFNHFTSMQLAKQNCPTGLEGWMGAVGSTGQHQVEFVGDKKTFCQKIIIKE